MTDKALVVIPARGGSKGIPRKNLRPLCGNPLLYYAVTAAGEVDGAMCVVTTEDEEIEYFARKFGALTIKRPDHLSHDDVTIDPVVSHAVAAVEETTGRTFDYIITVQPTSPLIEADDIKSAITMLRDDDSIETIISATDDRHLRWRSDGNRILPEYEQRVNRQQLPPTYRETGAIIGCRRKTLENGSRIGKTVSLLVLPGKRSIDIDDFSDFWLCEKIMSRKSIVIVVIGNEKVGMGHVYRGIMIAHELINYDIAFVCRTEDRLAVDYIRRHHYPVTIASEDKLIESIVSMRPDMVINDILDTTADFVLSLKKAGTLVVNFEDMGLGAEVADLVINALYPHQLPREQILVGPKYFCLREEFLHCSPKPFSEKVQRIIITFGGVDEGNLTVRVLRELLKLVGEAGVAVDVILGPGYIFHGKLAEMEVEARHPTVSIIKATSTISEYMAKADMAITSAGRTVLELASLGVPTIVICQNSRETTHTFASSENGILNLGLRTDITDAFIRENIIKVMTTPSLRKTMHERMLGLNLRSGKQRVIDTISALMPAGRSREWSSARAQ